MGQDRRMAHDAVFQAFYFEFLIRTVDPVVIEAKADHDRVEPQMILHPTHDRYRPTHPDEGRILVENILETGSCRPHEGVVRRHFDARRRTEARNVPPAVGRRAGIEEIFDFMQDEGWILSRHQTTGNFGRGVGRDHGLGPGPRITAPNPIDIAGRTRPDPFQNGASGLADRPGEADFTQKPGFVEGEIAPCLGFFHRQFPHIVVESGDLDHAMGIVQLGQHPGQRIDRIDDGPTIEPGMQIPARPMQRHFDIEHAAQAIGDGRRIDVPGIRVGDDRHVGGEFIAVGAQEIGQGRAAGFFFAFEHDRHLDRQAARHLGPAAKRFEKGHDLALVVHGTARHNTFAVFGVDDRRLERRAIPEFEGIGRLNVVMTVIEQMGDIRSGMGRTRVVGDHDGMTRRLAQARVKPHPGQFIDQPLPGTARLVAIGGIGRDRFDPQEIEIPVQRAIEIAFEMP